MTTITLALLILRCALGVMIFAHGWNKVFGAGGISGTAGWFEALGLRPGRVHAVLAATTEMGAGILLAAGLATQAAALAVVALMTVATLTDHRGKGFFVFKGGWEYTVVTAAVASALVVSGPGEWSVDALIDLPLAGITVTSLCILLAVAAGTLFVRVARAPHTTTA